jgi:hypothetical protein
MQFMNTCVFLEYQTMNKVQRPSNPEGDDHNRTAEFLQDVVYFSAMFNV